MSACLIEFWQHQPNIRLPGRLPGALRLSCAGASLPVRLAISVALGSQHWLSWPASIVSLAELPRHWQPDLRHQGCLARSADSFAGTIRAGPASAPSALTASALCWSGGGSTDHAERCVEKGRARDAEKQNEAERCRFCAICLFFLSICACHPETVLAATALTPQSPYLLGGPRTTLPNKRGY